MNTLPTDFLNRIKKVLPWFDDALGPLILFGLFKREGSSGLWDVVISAGKSKVDQSSTLRTVAEALKKGLKDSDFEYISRIAIADPDSPWIQVLAMGFEADTLLEVSNTEIFGMKVEHAYIFRLHNPKSKTPAR